MIQTFTFRRIGDSMEFTYKWKHIPTGLTGTRTAKFRDDRHLMESINDWNRRGDGFWVYWY